MGRTWRWWLFLAFMVLLWLLSWWEAGLPLPPSSDGGVDAGAGFLMVL